MKMGLATVAAILVAGPPAVSTREREIDQVVYRLYALTGEEIAIVEGEGK